MPSTGIEDSKCKRVGREEKGKKDGEVKLEEERFAARDERERNI